MLSIKKRTGCSFLFILPDFLFGFLPDTHITTGLPRPDPCPVRFLMGRSCGPDGGRLEGLRKEFNMTALDLIMIVLAVGLFAVPVGAAIFFGLYAAWDRWRRGR